MAPFADSLLSVMKHASVLTIMMVMSPLLLLVVLPLALLASGFVAVLGAMSLAPGLARQFAKVNKALVQGVK